MNQQAIILNQAVNFSGTVCRGITGTLCAEYPMELNSAGQFAPVFGGQYAPVFPLCAGLCELQICLLLLWHN